MAVRAKPLRKPDFTERELRAILDALALALAGELDNNEDGDAMETARLKIALYREKGRV
jgi:hypothetical protein